MRKGSLLIFFFCLVHLITLGQCIEKQISETSTSTYYLNARNQPTKIISVSDGEKSTFSFKYDAKGNCILVDLDGEYKVKGVYNSKNQLISSICSFRAVTITNTYQYMDNMIVKIITAGDLLGGLNTTNFETMLTYENGNIIGMDVLDKEQDTLKTVISQVTYDNQKRYLTKEETLVSLGFFSGTVGTSSILELSRNNPLKFSYLNLEPDENCGSGVIDIVYEYEYDASNRVKLVKKKETCGEKVTTSNTSIERTCK